MRRSPDALMHERNLRRPDGDRDYGEQRDGRQTSKKSEENQASEDDFNRAYKWGGEVRIRYSDSSEAPKAESRGKNKLLDAF